ncbi:antiviral reverse transcriptase Drt3a [Sphingomonas sp. Leaf208]|uniref:antiviral reverse transcriptase Drt3a n=1 Tax=Sphingomonas sp. Leaf208 TaxID=1735679 RepID=UPI0009EA4416|nr:antiviral reverse transcriptase Drt3a [Sphingomonas sp. Leaf208]
MYDSTIHSKTISRQFRKSDFKSKVWTATKADRPAITKAALRLAEHGFETVALRRNDLGGKPIYRHASLPEALLIRHVAENVRRVTGVHQSDRQSIVKSLVNLLAEGVPFNVAKIDIRSFYESIDPSNILLRLESDAAFSRQSISVLKCFFSALREKQISGLPRGIGLSATLSEYLLRDFDRNMAAIKDVRFYSRYVDDIIVVSTPEMPFDEVIQEAKSFLPQELEFNRSKTNGFGFKPYSNNAAKPGGQCITYLGYDITVDEITNDGRSSARNVLVDMSKKKVGRLKRRLCKALLAFNSGGSFADLLDRVKILTSNFGYHHETSGQTRYAGIRFNYPLINPETAKSLDLLDRFLINTVTSTHKNNRIRPTLTQDQRISLLGMGFKTGFVDSRFYSFKDDRLRHLTGCWLHA